MSIDLDDAFGAYSREELEETLRSILRFAAIARSLALESLAGVSGRGYYFGATDRAPKPASGNI
jgi:hypothetical protein